MDNPGYKNYEYIIRDHCVLNLSKFRQIWLDYGILLQSPWKFALVGFLIPWKWWNALILTNFKCWFNMTSLLTNIWAISGHNSRIANIYPFVFKICAKMLFGALIMIVSMESDIFQILVHYDVIIDPNLGQKSRIVNTYPRKCYYQWNLTNSKF